MNRLYLFRKNVFPRHAAAGCSSDTGSCCRREREREREGRTRGQHATGYNLRPTAAPPDLAPGPGSGRPATPRWCRRQLPGQHAALAPIYRAECLQFVCSLWGTLASIIMVRGSPRSASEHQRRSARQTRRSCQISSSEKCEKTCGIVVKHNHAAHNARGRKARLNSRVQCKCKALQPASSRKSSAECSSRGGNPKIRNRYHTKHWGFCY